MSTLTAITDKLRSISPELEGVIAALQVIQSASSLGGQSAATALAVVAAAVHGLEQSAAGAITHQQLLDQLHEAQETLATQREAEDRELAARFPAPAPAPAPAAAPADEGQNL